VNRRSIFKALFSAPFVAALMPDRDTGQITRSIRGNEYLLHNAATEFWNYKARPNDHPKPLTADLMADFLERSIRSRWTK